MVIDLASDYKSLLASANYRVVQVDHPWLNLFLQNLNGRTALILRDQLPEGFLIHDGRGFSVTLERVGEITNLTISSREPGVNELFVQFVDYLVKRTTQASAKDSAIRLFGLAVKEFIAFSSKAPGRLTLQQTRGLFAELLFFRRVLDANTRAPDVLKAWKGPHHLEGLAMHDFVFAEGVAFEVKSSSHPSSEIRVSSALQLVPGKHSLHLVVVPLETLEHDAQSGITLSELSTQCIDAISELDPSCVADFIDALAGIGFDPRDNYYSQWKFTPEPWRFFEVRPGFPVLDLNSVPPAMTKIRYSLELALMSDFEVRGIPIFASEGEK
jgi:hypothetical protein